MKAYSTALLASVILFLTGCPSGNGHGPFDVLAGRSSVDDLLSDQGNSQGMILQKSLVAGSQSPSVYRGSSYAFSAYVKNATGNTVSTTSLDKIQFFYCLETAFPSSMYKTGGGASYGAFSNQQTLTTSYFSVGGSNLVYATTSSLVIPTALTSGQNYYVGVWISINGATNVLAATTNLAGLVKFAKISVL